MLAGQLAMSIVDQYKCMILLTSALQTILCQLHKLYSIHLHCLHLYIEMFV